MFSKGFHIDDQPKYESGDVSSRVLSYGPGLMLMEWHFKKEGMVTPMHSHYHEQITFVKKGSTKVTFSDGTEQIFKEGESIYFAPDEEHALVTMEDDCVMIDAFSPMRIDHLERHSK